MSSILKTIAAVLAMACYFSGIAFSQEVPALPSEGDTVSPLAGGTVEPSLPEGEGPPTAVEGESDKILRGAADIFTETPVLGKWFSREREEPMEDKPRIKKIELAGCEEISCRTVKSILRQEKTPWWKRKAGESGYDEFWAREDAERIRMFYRSKGYYNVAVTGPEVRDDPGGKVIAYRIEEGEPVRVDRIQIIFEDGLHEDHDPRYMRESLEFLEGDIFELDPYQDSAVKMETYYKNDGFFFAEVKRRAEIDPETRKAVVTYRITKGDRYKIGEITVEGTELTKPKVVLDAITLKTDDRYRRSEVYENQRKVQRLPIYRTVRIIERPRVEDLHVDLIIRVEEGDPHKVQAGVGYGTEEGIRVMGSWRHVNLLGGARDLTVAARWSELLEREEITFVQPNLRRSGDFIKLTAEHRVLNEEAFSYEAYSLVPTYHFILTNYLFMELSYRIEWNEVVGVPDDLDLRQEDLGKEGMLSAVGLRLEWSEIDDMVNPTRGALARLDAEYGGGIVGGDFHYYKFTGEVRGYYPIYDPVIIAAKYKLGYAEAVDDLEFLPLFLRYYTGGTGMVRGYERYGLGPEDDDGNPIGGVRLWESNVELRFPIWAALGGVVFVDSGWVWREDEGYDPDDVVYSAGGGVRYNTPIGPLALDLAFPLDPPSDHPGFRIHLNVGHTF